MKKENKNEETRKKKDRAGSKEGGKRDVKGKRNICIKKKHISKDI